MDSRASALARLKQQQRERGNGGPQQGADAVATKGGEPGPTSMARHPGGHVPGWAARSHEANDRYMADFHEALQRMGMQEDPPAQSR